MKSRKSGWQCYFGLGLGLLLLCASCVPIEKSTLVSDGNVLILLDPEAGLDESWEHSRLRRADTLYEQSESVFGHTIKATGNRSASILYRFFDPLDPSCDRLSWSWWVSEPQPSSDLHVKGKDDVAASVFILFGDPGIFLDHKVPTLKYVWANQQHQKGEIIEGPYHPEYIRSIVHQTGPATGNLMVREQVHLKRDFRRAFGKELDARIHGVAIFSDNDDTGDPIQAHYGSIELLCGE